ncbi:MAG: para-aminobenzoate synthase [Alphaproteobacteria bacterium]|nr:para-aminobenzoate synthase [Alphaproteobacteria bacterium]MDB5741538.1 para-aminobenzoate synthase [Alphaproteobacteria bacterium]
MLVILDDGPRRVFRNPLRVLAADEPSQVPGILDAVEQALAQGHFVAGWLGYELGYTLEPRLAGRAGGAPLLRLGVFAAPEAEASPPTGRAWAGPLTPEWGEGDYAARFIRVKDYIAAGDIYQANLSFRARFPFLGDARALYEQLRTQSGAGHCGFIDDGMRQIASLSPELFFDLTEDGVLTVRPMKGTAPRAGQDDAERAALAASPKNRAENLMIVDLIRNDLSRIGGDVAVSDLFKVETYPTLHTMVSTVTARKRDGVGVADILRALFPCGSVTGAPKIRAMEILRELETSPRGAYCGAVGCFAPDGSARFNVAIRTLTINGDHGTLGIGGGVVQDSQMDSEYAECLLKARFFEAARDPIELIETLRWEGGFARLDAHLARMAKSAAAFAMAYDDAAARAALDAAVAGRPGPLRVRLTLDEAGNHRATAHELPANPPHWTWALSPDRTDSRDQLLRHKTSRRELYDRAHPGVDEMIFQNQRGELTEGARSNIFVEQGGILLTPPLGAGVLPGILRAELIAQGKAREAILAPDDLNGTVWFGNALRGLIRGVRP